MKMIDKASRFIATVFFIGYCPVAPGTMGSLAAVGVYLLLKGNFLAMGYVILASLVIGFITSGRAEKILGKKDDKRIVIDEFAGMLVSLYLLPFHILNIALAFLLFRLLDILKPAFIKKVENLRGGLGIMGDDLLAGVMVNFILQVLDKAF